MFNFLNLLVFRSLNISVKKSLLSCIYNTRFTILTQRRVFVNAYFRVRRKILIIKIHNLELGFNDSFYANHSVLEFTLDHILLYGLRDNSVEVDFNLKPFI